MTSQGHSLLYPTGEGSHKGADVGQNEATSYKRVRRSHPTETDSLCVTLRIFYQGQLLVDHSSKRNEGV